MTIEETIVRTVGKTACGHSRKDEHTFKTNMHSIVLNIVILM